MIIRMLVGTPMMKTWRIELHDKRAYLAGCPDAPHVGLDDRRAQRERHDRLVVDGRHADEDLRRCGRRELLEVVRQLVREDGSRDAETDQSARELGLRGLSRGHREVCAQAGRRQWTARCRRR